MRCALLHSGDKDVTELTVAGNGVIVCRLRLVLSRVAVD
jgi:hypothetical protein